MQRFTPDFYLPQYDLYIEITTLNQKLVTKKNRKVRRLRELYPGVNCKIFYQRDYLSLVSKYGLEDVSAGRVDPSDSGHAVRAAHRRRRRRRCSRRSASPIDDLLRADPEAVRLDRPAGPARGRVRDGDPGRPRALAAAQPPAPTTSSASPAAARTTTTSRRGVGARRPVRVLHLVHAVPARALAGGAPGAVRVPVDDLRAHGARGLERVAVRRRDRAGRGREPRALAGRGRVLVARPSTPATSRRCETYGRGAGYEPELFEVVDGRGGAPEVGDDVACVVVQHPNAYGLLEPLGAVRRGARRRRPCDPGLRPAVPRRARPARGPPRRHRGRRRASPRQPPQPRRSVPRRHRHAAGRRPAAPGSDRGGDRWTSTGGPATSSPCRRASNTSAARRRRRTSARTRR